METLSQIFLRVLSMSLMGTLAALIVMAARWGLKRIAPRAVVCALWAVVLFRMICPLTLESGAALLPSAPEVKPLQVRYGAEAVTAAVPKEPAANPASVQAVSAAPSSPTGTEAVPEARLTPEQKALCAGAVIWLAGAAGIALRSLWSLLRLRRRLRARQRQDEGVYAVEGLETAFVLGVLRPRIYLPAALCGRERDYILMHEYTHIRRGDHIFKMLGYAALCLHWFNPVAWLSFGLFTRDVEVACDEAVIRRLGPQVKKEYSASLLRLATGRRIAAGTPLAFGQGDTRGRIRNVLNYKRPALWAVIAAMLLVAALCAGLAFSRPQEAYLQIDGVLYQQKGGEMDELPHGCVRLGQLESRTSGRRPERDLQASGLEVEWIGCELWGDGGEHVYVRSAEGAYLPFVSRGTAEGFALSDEELSHLVGVDALRMFNVAQLQGGRFFVGYVVDETDLGACALRRVDGQYQLYSSARWSGLAGRSGAGICRMWTDDQAWDVLVYDASQAALVERSLGDELTHVEREGPALAVLEVRDDQTAQEASFAFYDAAGAPIEIEVHQGEQSPVSGAGRVVSVAKLEYGKAVHEESGLTPAQARFVGEAIAGWEATSAAWQLPFDADETGECIRIVQLDAASGQEHTYYAYVFPELDTPVMREEGSDWCSTLSRSHWAMLRAWMSGEENPRVIGVTLAVGDETVTEITPLEDEERVLALDMLASAYAASSLEEGIDLSGAGDRYIVRETYLNGSAMECCVYSEEGHTYLQWADSGLRTEIAPSYGEALAALFDLQSAIETDLDGDGRNDRVWWGVPNSDRYGVTLYISLGDGRLMTRSVEAVRGESLLTADVTGDGLPELIAMADTGGVGGAGCYVLEILTMEESELRALPVPFYQEYTPEEPSWWASGYRFVAQYEDGFALHVRSDLLDETVDLAQDEEALNFRIEVGQYDEDGKALYRSDFEQSGCDGICAVEVIKGTEGCSLRLYQYLYIQGHSDGVGFGVSTVKWDGERFVLLEQGWSAELP